MMHKKAIILFIVTAFLFSGCSRSGYFSQETAEDYTEWVPVTVYCRDREGLVIPATIKFGRRDNSVKTAVDSLIYSVFSKIDSDIQGLYSVFPEGTEVLETSLSGTTITVNFNKNLLNYADAISERCIVSSIVYTLTEIDEIENVVIRVENENPGMLRFSTDISGPLNRKNTLINAKRINVKSGLTKLDIFLTKNVNGMSIHFVPVSVEYKIENEDDIPSIIVELLGRDYSARKLYTHLPPGTRLLGSSIEGNVLSIDLSSEFLNYSGGISQETAIVDQVVYSMMQLEKVESVKILIEGREALFPEGTEASAGIMPAFINLLYR